MAFLFERISLYLNLVTKKLNDPRNQDADGNVALSWLTGKADLKIPAGAGIRNPIETQVLAINNGGSACWIANNDPNDTVTQRNYLAALGIDTFAKLQAHVDTFQGSMLPTNGGRLGDAVRRGDEPDRGRMTMRRNNAEGKEGLLYLMMMDGKEEAEYVAPPFLDAAKVASKAVARFTLDNAEALPPAGLCFITGDYEGAGGGTMHAEQRMLAALSRMEFGVSGRKVEVAGCKGACAGCASALANAQASLGSKKCNLVYDNPESQILRTEAGIGDRGAVPGLCILNPESFPAPEVGAT